MSSDRRRSPRIELLGRMHGHVVSLDVSVTVKEMSLGGMSMEASVPFPVGAVHEFRLTLGDESSAVLKGRIMYSRSVGAPGEPPVYLSGVQFIDDESPADSSPAGGLIDKIK
jgi:hypothetical protein